MEHHRHSDAEISMLPSPSPAKKIHTPSPRRPWNVSLGFKLSHLILAVAIALIIVINLKIMFETHRTYNESLVNQLSSKNEMLERTLVNLSATANDRNVLLEKLLELNEYFQLNAVNRSERLEDKIEATQQLVVQLVKENKLMFSTSERNFMDTLKLVREALTMNTNTVIRLLDENTAIQNKLHRLEETVMSSQRRRSAMWTNDATTNVGRGRATVIGVLILFGLRTI